MQNLHDDKNLDRLAREAADEFSPDDSLHNWEKLKPGLDREMPEKKEKKRRFIFILFFFLLVGGGIVSAIWLNGNGTKQEAGVTDNANTPSVNKSATPGTTPVVDKPADSSNEPDEKVSPGTTTTTPVDIVTKSIDNPGNSPKQLYERVNASKQNQAARKKNGIINDGPDYDMTIIKDKIVAGNKTKSDNKPLADNKTVTDNKTVIDNKTVADNKTVTDNKTVADNKTVPENKTFADNKTGAEDKIIAEDKQVKEDKPLAENKPVPDKKDSSVKEQPAITEQPITKAKATNKSRNPSVAASRWEFGAVYAPDISTVKFTHTQKPGTNVGLLVGYNISRRFAVQAGAIYTTKNYKSRGSDYHPPKGYWTDYVKLESVTADCDMWDIPINLRYNLVPKHRSNLFIITGLSSYIMGSEDYDYRYYYANNPNLMSRYRTYDTNSQHWASILNLSIGYERQINKSFSIQAEPFFKQPLKGVGFGSVKLNSTGIYFSVKYKPVAKSRK